MTFLSHGLLAAGLGLLDVARRADVACPVIFSDHWILPDALRAGLARLR